MNKGDIISLISVLIASAVAAGLAIGRNIWQSDNPMERTRKLKEIIFGR